MYRILLTIEREFVASCASQRTFCCGIARTAHRMERYPESY